MKSVDTNVLVRLIADDDPVQYALAQTAVNEGVFVPLTVFLELGWVLASRLRMSRERVFLALQRLLDNPGIHVAGREGIEIALSLYRGGADFADAVHLVAARGTEAFVTFDRGVPDGEALGVPVERIG